MIEVEIKLPANNLQEIKGILLQNGFVEEHHVREHDIYFYGERQIKARGEALRIREITDFISGKVLAQINFKGQKMDQQTMTRQELETELASAKIGVQLLSAIGFYPVAPEVIKDRQTLVCGDMTACLDQVTGLGEFLELEILVAEYEDKSPIAPLLNGEANTSDESVRKEEAFLRQQAMERIEATLQMLGYAVTDTVTTSYLSMLQKKQSAAYCLHLSDEQI